MHNHIEMFFILPRILTTPNKNKKENDRKNHPTEEKIKQKLIVRSYS